MQATAFLDAQLTKSQKQRLKVSGMHVGVRASPPTYKQRYFGAILHYDLIHFSIRQDY